MIKINQQACDGCGSCIAVCPDDAIILNTKELIILEDRCRECNKCVSVCPVGALEEITGE